MKKGKILLACSSAVFILSLVVGCSENIDLTSDTITKQDANTDSSVDSGEDNKELEDATISDAYENTRPDYGNEFDYDSEYEPLPPPDDNKTYVLSFRDGDNSPVKFKGGKSSIELKANAKLTIDDLEVTDVGRTLAGFAILSESGDSSDSISLDSFAMPRRDTVIYPYFGVSQGYTKLNIGSGQGSKFNFDTVPGDFHLDDEDKGLKQNIFYKGNVVVSGDIAKGGYSELGARIDSDVNAKADSAIRLDTKREPITDGTSPHNFEFLYNFENFGDTSINLNLWQINASSEYKVGKGYETRPHIDIELEAGESTTLNLKDYIGKNGNFLTYIVLEEDLTGGLHLGMSMSAKVLEDDPDPVEKKGIIKLDLPEGVTVNGFTEEQLVDTPVTVPTANQITNTTGRKILGWYVKGSNAVVDNYLRVTEQGFTICPYFDAKEGRKVTFLYREDSGNTGICKPDYFGKVSEIGSGVDNPDYDDTLFTAEAEFADYQKGTRLTYPKALKKDDYFRCLSLGAVEANVDYEFIYEIKNNGTDVFKFKAYQVASKNNITEESGATSSESITIEAGKTQTVRIRNNFKSSNINSMVIFVLEQDMSKLDIGVNFAIKEVTSEPDPDPVKATLSIGGGSTVTFENEATSLELVAGSSFPNVTNLPDGRTIAGWLNANGEKVDLTNWKMPEVATTLTPYFSAQEGYDRVWIGTGQHYGKANNFTGSLDGSLSKWEATAKEGTGYNNSLDSAKTIVKGSNGVAEEGIRIKYNGSMITGDQFRLNTSTGDASIDGQPGPVNAGNHSLIYNFENRGTAKISFSLWMVNTQNDKTSVENNEFEVVLEPNESTTVVVNPTYTNESSNKNLLTLFEAKEDMPANLDLAVSMSIKYNAEVNPPVENTANIKLDLPQGITVTGYNEEQEIGSAVAIPTEAQITNETGRTILGWYVTESGAEITTETLVTENGFTIAPYLDAKEGTKVVFLNRNDSGNVGICKPDYFGPITNIGEKNDIEGYVKESFTVKEEIADYQKGTRLTYPQTLKKDDYFRCLSRERVEANTNYEFSYEIKNNSTSAFKFRAVQVASGCKISESDGAVTSSSMVINAGETQTVSIKNKFSSGNDNSMVIFILEEDTPLLDISVNMTIKEVAADPAETFKLSIGGGSSVKFKDAAATTVDLEAGAAFPEVTDLPEGRTIAGWLDESGKKVDISTWTMPQTATTLTPYFSVESGYKNLWLGSEQADGRPNNYAGTISGNVDKWSYNGTGTQSYNNIKDDAKTIVKGSNGVAEEGVRITYSSTMTKDDAFRFSSFCGASSTDVQPGPVTAGTHSFKFNFENRGTSKISFDVWIVNSSVNIDSASNNKFEVTLEPGECITVNVTPTYGDGTNNKSALVYFKVKEDITSNLDMAVSMSVKYNVQ